MSNQATDQTASNIPAGAKVVSPQASAASAAPSAPEIPQTASEAPISGVQATKDVSFVDQVKGHAKYFAGKTFGNDKEVQEGAAKVRGEL